MFKKPLLEKVLSGEKTQTRRDIKRRPGVQVFSVGQVVGIRAGYTEYIGAIRIVGRRQENLGEISEEDAKKEGCDGVEEFRSIWIRLFGNWDPDQVVWVYDFVLADMSDLTNKDSIVEPAANLLKSQ